MTRFGGDGPPQPAYDLRTPWRTSVDLTVFKNVAVKGRQAIQFRAGVFNVFNTAFVGQAVADVDLTLDARCKVLAFDVPNGTNGSAQSVCDPTGGFEFTEQTKENFGTIRAARPPHRAARVEVHVVRGALWSPRCSRGG